MEEGNGYEVDGEVGDVEERDDQVVDGEEKSDEQGSKGLLQAVEKLEGLSWLDRPQD